MEFPFNTKKLGWKAMFEPIDHLVPVDIYGVVAPDVWRAGGVEADQLGALGIEPADHIICEFDQGHGPGSELYDCGRFGDYDRVRQNIIGFSQALGNRMAIRVPRWYRLPEPTLLKLLKLLCLLIDP